MSTGEGTLVFDRYQIIRRLAAGGMGEIFLARQVVGLDRLVILKCLLPHLAQDVEAVTRFINEARVAATLNHPNIVSIYEVGSWNDIHFIVMEYIGGEHLGQVTAALAREQRNMPPQVALHIMRDTLTALDFAHHAKSADGKPVTVVHRDVSPQNVMIREDGVVKVVDFGIAIADSMAIRTRTGFVRGKLPYLAPELLQGSKANARSDQYAAGVVAWELLTGRRLFQGPRDGNMMTAICDGNVPAPSMVQPSLSPEIDEWILTMLETDPERRYERCAAAARVATNLTATYSNPNDDSDVAAFISTVIAGSVAEKERALTPTTGVVLMQRPDTQAPERADPTVIVNMPDKRRRMRIAAGAVAAIGVATLAALLVSGEDTPGPQAASLKHTARLVLVSHPTGASVMSGDTLLGTTPVTLDSLPPQVTHNLRVILLHHQSVDVAIRLNEGEERHIRVDLTPSPTLATNQLEPPPRSPPQRTSSVKTKETPQTKPAQPAAADAQLTIRTKPWTRVIVDGQDRGITPLKITLAPGSHALIFENPEAKLRQSKKIVLSSGEVQKLDLDLSK